MPRMDLVLDIHFLLLLYSQLLIAIDVCTLECTHCISIHILNNKHINLHTLYLQLLGVRSLANASRARQFNPLNDQNPPGVG